MEEWYSISEIAEQLNLAENTARRYANLFKEFLRDKQFGRTTKYTGEAAGVFKRISLLYHQGLNTHEIKEKLANELPQTFDIVEGASIPIVSPQELMAQLNESLQQIATATEQIAKQEEFRKKQEAFNEALAERLEQQEVYIEESLRKRDEQLMSVVREMLEAKKKKKWWQIWTSGK